MKVTVEVGDVLEHTADALISTANPWLNMSGGVNGAIRELAPGIQEELNSYLKSISRPAVSAGTVVRTSTGSLPFLHIIHAVAIDPFYDSSHDIIVKTLAGAFQLAETLQARSISLPTLATGYGPLSITDFGRAFAVAVSGLRQFESVTIVVRSIQKADTLRSVLDNPIP